MPGSFDGGLVAAWEYFLHLAVVLIPLFVGGSFLVGLLQEYLPPERVERLLRRYDGGTGNVVAAGVGAITPFCSCSTVPVLAGLLGAGAPVGLGFSFLLASPLVNELAVLLLVGLFGLKVAVSYVALTLLAAVVGGLLVGWLGMDHHLRDVQLLSPDGRGVATDGGATPDCCGSAAPDRGERTGPRSDCSVRSGVDRGGAAGRSTHRERVRRAARGAGGFFVDLLPYLVLGMTLGAAIHGFVPTALVHRLIGPENPLAVPLAAVAGAPIYVSMSAMLPIAASFADGGIPIGTVLAFVVGSAGVSLPNLVLLHKLFDRTLLAIYAVVVVTTGILIGVTFNAALA